MVGIPIKDSQWLFPVQHCYQPNVGSIQNQIKLPVGERYAKLRLI